MRSDIIERASVRNVSQGKDYALTLRKEHRGTYVWRTDAGTSVAFGRNQQHARERLLASYDPKEHVLTLQGGGKS